uniref:Uncharacterized protein n=1 Tax=Pyricularia oryzae (strain P131) TaxID=1143193 RepID=L7JF26_PYRO1
MFCSTAGRSENTNAAIIAHLVLLGGTSRASRALLLEVLGIGSDSLSVVGAVSLALASIISRSSLFSCWISSLRKLAMLRSLSASPLARASMRSLFFGLADVLRSDALLGHILLQLLLDLSLVSERFLEKAVGLVEHPTIVNKQAWATNGLLNLPWRFSCKLDLQHLSYLCNFQAAVRVCHMDASAGNGMAA